MEEEHEVKFSLSVDEAKEVISCLLAIGARPELAFESIVPIIKALINDDKRDLSEVCGLLKVFRPYFGPNELQQFLALINDAVPSSDERIFIDLWSEWQKDGTKEPLDFPVYIFIAMCLWRSKWTYEHFADALNELDIKMDKLLRRLNAEVWYEMTKYYGRIRDFFANIKAVGGNVNQFADSLTSCCRFEIYDDLEIVIDILKALLAVEADEVYLDRVCPDRVLRERLLERR